MKKIIPILLRARTPRARTPEEIDALLRDDTIEPAYLLETIVSIPSLIRTAVVASMTRINVAVGTIYKSPIARRPKGVPKDWVKKPANDGEGFKYVKPGTKGNTDVPYLDIRRIIFVCFFTLCTNILL